MLYYVKIIEEKKVIFVRKCSIFFVTVSLIIILTGGCGNRSGSGNAETRSNTADNSNSTDQMISVTSEITELESGFSAVRYAGDYAFDLFLEQGGAASDRDVLSFLTSTLLGGAPGLQTGAATLIGRNVTRWW